MDSPGCKIHSYIEEVEKFMTTYKQQVEEEMNGVENSVQQVSHLLNSFFTKETHEISEDSKSMTISLPNRSSVFETICKEDVANGFLFHDDREEKKKRLAAERRAEYNAYLKKKEQELLANRKAHDEMSVTTTPRSVLESVDYNAILAKRKEEELKFRQFNHAEPSLSGSVNNGISFKDKSDTHEKITLPREYNKKSSVVEGNINASETNSVTSFNLPNSRLFRGISNRPISAEEFHIRRTGGGGEPVRDSFGNLITARGFKDSVPILSLPSFKESSTSSNKSLYREELARQIEEKKRLELLEKQKIQESDDREAQRIEKQRRQMQLEYENEMKSNYKIREQKQQERTRRIEEFKRNDVAIRQKLKEDRINEAKQALTEITNNTQESRSSSPPVPAVRSKVIFEKTITPVQSPVHSIIEVAVKPESIFSSLAEIRRKIKQDQQYYNREVKGSYEVMNRRTVPDILADEDDYDIQGISENIEYLKA